MCRCNKAEKLINESGCVVCMSFVLESLIKRAASKIISWDRVNTLAETILNARITEMKGDHKYEARAYVMFASQTCCGYEANLSKEALQLFEEIQSWHQADQRAHREKYAPLEEGG